jgi:hypothetical protein
LVRQPACQYPEEKVDQRQIHNAPLVSTSVDFHTTCWVNCFRTSKRSLRTLRSSACF